MNAMIRSATTADIAGIQTLASRVLALEITDTAALERYLKRIYSAESLLRALESEGVTTLVAEQDGQIVGLCSYGSPLMDDCEDLKEIHRLFVHPDYTKQGIGTAFVELIEDDLLDDEEADILRMSVYIKPDDKARLRFYAKLGFHHDLIEDKEGEWYMEKEL